MITYSKIDEAYFEKYDSIPMLVDVRSPSITSFN